MTNSHINKQGMYLVVIGVLTKFSTLVAAIPAFGKAVAAFTQLVTNIGKTSEEVGIGTSPLTKAKRTAEDAMAEAVVSLVGKLHAYAADKEDVALMDQTDINESDIHDTREASRADYSTKQVDVVESHKADLAGDYAVSDANIAAARQSITDYSASLGGRNTAKTGQSSGRDSVMNMFARADYILEHNLDKFAKSLKKDHPDFYAEYDAARVIKDIAAHRKGKNGGTPGSTPKPPDTKQ